METSSQELKLTSMGIMCFPDIDPGTYDVEVSYVGFQTQRQTGVLVLAGKSNRVDFELSSGVLLQEIEVKERMKLP